MHASLEVQKRSETVSRFNPHSSPSAMTPRVDATRGYINPPRTTQPQTQPLLSHSEDYFSIRRLLLCPTQAQLYNSSAAGGVKSPNAHTKTTLSLVRKAGRLDKRPQARRSASLRAPSKHQHQHHHQQQRQHQLVEGWVNEPTTRASWHAGAPAVVPITT